MSRVELHHGDCLDVLRGMPDCSVDAVVTDPPYGLSFMGKKWDYDVPQVEVWEECLRILKPGGHLLAFAGTRTQHRMAVRIEDAGFEIRDMIAWVYGSGFPKSHDVSKAIDKSAGAERDVLHTVYNVSGERRSCMSGDFSGQRNITVPATPEAEKWSGWGTALKPALEPITLARKPFNKTVAANVLEYGTGALNVGACRVGDEAVHIPERKGGMGGITMGVSHGGVAGGYNHGPRDSKTVYGRWPANLIHDGGEEVGELFGKSARFFYSPKASKADRDSGLDDFEKKNNMRVNAPIATEDDKRATRLGNIHPTVKPTELMRYLCRLVTPPGGTVLDPFMGSGSTGRGAVLEGFRFVGIERELEYIDIARARIAAASAARIAAE